MVQMDGRQRMVGERGWRVQASESKAQSDTIGEYPGTSPYWGVSRLSGVTCRWKRRFVTETLRKKETRRDATKILKRNFPVLSGLEEFTTLFP